MGYKVKIRVGVLSIVLFSLFGSWLLITATSYFFSFVCLVVILLITLFIIRLMNETDRRVSLFFSMLRDHEASFRLPENADDGFLRELYAEMNRIIGIFGENRKEVEESRVYYESILRVLTHEMRNSITPITSLSADLLHYPETYTPGQSRESLTVIHDQAKSLSVFLDSYHRLTHLPEPEREEIDLSSLFRKIARLLCAEKDSDRIQFQSPDNLFIQADPNLVVLALINLIRNALSAISGQADGIVRVEASCCGGATHLSISDNGPGIPPDLLSTIFTPFFTTKPGGSGIGLSISRRIMRLHGGELRVASIPGIRTMFTLVFPS